MTGSEQQAFDTIKILWIFIGTLAIGNAGTLLTLYVNHRRRSKDEEARQKKDKEETQSTALNGLTSAVKENTKAVENLDRDLQRAFTALKLLAGSKKWNQISRIIQEEHPGS